MFVLCCKTCHNFNGCHYITRPNNIEFAELNIMQYQLVVFVTH